MVLRRSISPLFSSLPCHPRLSFFRQFASGKTTKTRLSGLASISMLIALILTIAVGEGDARTVQASEILSKIVAQSPVNYTNVTIEGDLCFNDGFVSVGKYLSCTIIEEESTDQLKINASCFAERLTNLTRISSPITSRDYITRRVAILNSSLINGPIIIANSTSIKSPITIRDSIIKGVFEFNNTTFQEPVLITNTTFCKEAYFVKSIFEEYADFSGSDFAFADFSVANFTKYAKFEQARFNGPSAFPGTTFCGYADFNGAQFNGYTDFFAARILPYVKASQDGGPKFERRWIGERESPYLYPILEFGSHLKFKQISSNISFNNANFSKSAGSVPCFL
ncbi:MAG TPA: pentapeptide repeat-containing protein [Methanothrix sp.]|jgi:hypothetical protein|nr:pentapeptide repeat-containing protein [Methanothrix sp.]